MPEEQPVINTTVWSISELQSPASTQKMSIQGEGEESGEGKNGVSAVFVDVLHSLVLHKVLLRKYPAVYHLTELCVLRGIKNPTTPPIQENK